MKDGVASNQDGDELGVFLEEPGDGHHHVGVNLRVGVPVPEEDQVLAPRLGGQGRLLELLLLLLSFNFSVIRYIEHVPLFTGTIRRIANYF